MASKRMMLLAIVMLLMFGNTTCKISSKSVERIEKGLAGGQKVVEFLSKLGDPKTSRVFDSLAKMAGFLGAAGGLLSFALAFVPKSDSLELRYMKEKFAEVNSKLDIINSKLDNVKDLITYENQRAAYLDSASKILFGHNQLSAFLNELQNTSCADEKNCNRVRARIASRYVNDFNVKQHMFKLLNGAIKPTSAFGEPLLNVIRKTFKCDIGKIDHLANSILKLSFKAQQVILAHEKLTGSNFSITQSMNDWLKSLYVLREMTYNTKKQCFDQISSYMIADINDKKYQVNVGSNHQANQEVKKVMEEKYKWLGWVAHSYGAYGGSKHCVQNPYGAFWNMPADKNARKRNLIVSFIDKSGTYSDQKFLVLKAIDQIVTKTNFYSVRNDACKLLPKVVKELKKEGVWKYVTSLNVLREYDDLVITADNALTYIDEEYTFKSHYPHNNKKNTLIIYDKVRLVIILKSMEIANRLTCDKSCDNQGSCRTQPYSSAKYCQCKAYFQGDKCEEHAEAQLAKTIDSLLLQTLKLPYLSDIAYDIKDLREYVGISFGEVRSAISDLEAAFKKAFDNLTRMLTGQFQWSNLITLYNKAIRQIEFYSYRFQKLPKPHPNTSVREGKLLATAVLAANGIQKWLYEVNFLFLGRTGTPLVKHEPLILVFMNRYKSLACTPAYKAAVDNTWRQLVLLQQMGFVVWAQALQIMGRPTEQVAQLYDARTNTQVSIFNQKTCEYSIANSDNVQCTGGRYLYPAMNIMNQCKANYYITGTKETTCVKKGSGCSACNCNAIGSNGMECFDISGQCRCKSGFYGNKCQSRDCVWGQWSAYSSCTKGCDYGGTKTRTRPHQVTKQGQGRSCYGSNTETTSCFNRCCGDQFHCSNRKKCIHLSYKCNYNNDCGDKQDEASCSERCWSKSTSWNNGGGGDMVYLDRHRLTCGGSGGLKMFRLRRSGGNIKYEYICCALTSNVCANTRIWNGFTYDGNGDTVYLDRQTISCGNHGYINGFWLERNGGHDRVRYSYDCCNLKNYQHRARTTCYTSRTSFTYDGNGKSYYLDRQSVQCNHRYFLTYIQLQRNGGHDRLRYQFTCCKIQI